MLRRYSSRILLLTIFWSLAQASCSGTQNAKKATLDRAKFDLNCDKIALQELSSGSQTYTIGAQGCGKRATYLVECNGAGAACVAELNSPKGTDAK